MKYLFFLIIFLIPVGLASAEVGKNFDTKPVENGLIQWTSHPDRIFNGVEWKNYLYTNDVNSIKYESAGISFKLDKTDCTFDLYDSGLIEGKTPGINSFSHNLKVDGVDIVESCTISSVVQTPESIQVTVNNGKFSTVYDLSYLGFVEWTFDLDNKEGKESTFTIEDTCKDCTPEIIEGDLIKFGDFILDTKNREHDTLKNSTNEKGDYVMTFEKTLNESEKFSIDPTFFSAGTSMQALVGPGAIGSCPVVGSGIAAASLTWTWWNSGSVNGCALGVFEVDVTSISDRVQFSNSSFTVTTTSVTLPGASNDITKISSATQPSTRPNDVANGLALFNEGLTGTILVSTSKWTTCAPCLNEDVDLGTTADSLFTSDVNSGKNWIAIALMPTTRTRDGSDRTVVFTVATARLTLTYSPAPNAVTDLIATDIRGTAVDLSWTAPNANGGTIIGYQINYTTPWANPLTIINPNTGNTITISTVSPLTGLTNYSFRVSAIASGLNGSGNILNITTDFDATASFTPGTFDITTSGVDIRTFKFNRTDTVTTTILGVTYPNTFNATCNFYFKFALTNNTFTNLADVPENALEDTATFTFQGLNNDIIDVNCFDTPSNVTGTYLITQTHFAFQDQIDNFRNGTFGTHGQFGAFDLITIFAILFSMIGFNRINAPVGAVLSIVVLGAFAYFGLIQWYTGATVLVAIVILFAFTTHRDSGD